MAGNGLSPAKCTGFFLWVSILSSIRPISPQYSAILPVFGPFLLQICQYLAHSTSVWPSLPVFCPFCQCLAHFADISNIFPVIVPGKANPTRRRKFPGMPGMAGNGDIVHYVCGCLPMVFFCSDCPSPPPPCSHHIP